MKKITILFIGLAFLNLSCNKKEKVETETVATDSTMVVDHHTSQLSLDYLGTYKGIIPCADCEGIETALSLIDESNYQLTTLYLGKSKKPFEVRGTYSWKEDGNTIVLAGLDGGANQYKVVENSLIQLDLQGNRVTGELGRKYVLQKEFEEVSFADEEVMNQIKEEVMKTVAKKIEEKERTLALVKTKWRLVELNGKEMVSKDQKSKNFFIEFTRENRFSAFAGCNNLMGSFELKEDAFKINFSKVASTKMACEDMNTEQEFADMLGKVDNYSIDENNLSFNKARMAPLARFEAIQ